MSVKISVVIPCYNEEAYLGETLEALWHQDVPREHFEVVVVDNNSKDATVAVAKHKGADKIVSETRQGTNFARQAGIDAASGEIIAFLDADCIPPAGWLSYILHALNNRHPKTVGIAGAYRFNLSKTDPLYWADHAFMWLFYPAVAAVMGKMLKKGGVIIGGNFATYKKFLVEMGGLDTSKVFFGDDASIAKRLGQFGHVKFDPKLYVLSSTRRFEREGLIRTNLHYIKHYVKVMMIEK